MIVYTSTLHWPDFLKTTAQTRAFSDLNTAMSLVNERVTSIDFTASLAYIELNTDGTCTGSRKNGLTPGMTKKVEISYKSRSRLSP